MEEDSKVAKDRIDLAKALIRASEKPAKQNTSKKEKEEKKDQAGAAERVSGKSPTTA